MSKWWKDRLNPEGLSQGDIIGELPHCLSPVPPVNLTKSAGKKGKQVWQASEDKKTGLFLYKGRYALCMVVSHDCELDKSGKRRRVLVAPARPLDELNDETLANVLGQKRISLVPLPDIPGHGGYYADLRLITVVDREAVDKGERIASMSKEGLTRLHAQLMLFFLRKAPSLLQGA